EWDSSLPGVREYPEVRLAAKRWQEQQDGQRILLTTASVLLGYRVEDLTVTDDTVLEEHNEDPALVQMRLIGDGVVESILRGENVGITPRRSRSSALLHQTQSQPLHQVSHGKKFIRILRPNMGQSHGTCQWPCLHSGCQTTGSCSSEHWDPTVPRNLSCGSDDLTE
ncbi:unnamed protein product, partial [Acanthoscelides obtectus]